MKMANDLPDQEIEAARVLQHINANENITILNSHHWNKDEAKVKFLMGKTTYITAIIAEPLTEQEAQQAVVEYKELMGLV